MKPQSDNNNQAEQEKISQVFLENEELIKSVIYAKIYDRQQAEDIFQDFFLSFVASPPKNQENLSSYFRTRLTRDIIDLSRKNQRYRSLIDRYSKERPRKSPQNESPDFEIIAEDERNKTIKILSENLSKTEAKAVKLRYVDGYDTTETSELMSVKKRSASRYLAIGLKKLRKVFNSDLVDETI